jgi:hypothetical protein
LSELRDDINTLDRKVGALDAKLGRNHEEVKERKRWLLAMLAREERVARGCGAVASKFALRGAQFGPILVLCFLGSNHKWDQ